MRSIMFAKTTLACALLLALGNHASAQRVDNAEYFWDTDPGAGNATAMSAEDGAFDEAVEGIFLNTTALPGLGTHTLGIRVKDQNNNWGPVFRVAIVIEPSVVSALEITVTEAEFFWDSDPGEGNGTPMLAFDGNFNEALEAISLETSALPADGVHVLNVRSQDVNSVWSTPFQLVVEVFGGSVTFPDISVTAAEYYVNTDPGAGNGTPMLAVDGNFSAALEAIKGGGIPAPVVSGANVLWLRARDTHNEWGPSFGVVVNIDTTITGTVGVEELVFHNDVRLAPNPANAGVGFSILLDTPVENLRVQVLDAAGRIVSDRSSTATSRVDIPLRDAAAGVYQVGIYMDGVSRWERLVVH